MTGAGPSSGASHELPPPAMPPYPLLTRSPCHARRPPGAVHSHTPSRSSSRHRTGTGRTGRHARRPARCGTHPPARTRSRPTARRSHPAPRHDPGLRRHRRPGRMALEGRLRGLRSCTRPLPAALRPRHAPRSGRRCRRPRRHAAHAGHPRRTRAFPDAPLRAAAPPATVLDAAASGLCRPPGCRHPPRRRRPGAFGRHRHAGRDGPARARQGSCRRAAPQRDRRRPRRPPRHPLPRQHGQPPQRGVHQGPASGAASHRDPDEPALLGEPRRGADPPSRRSASHPLGLLDAAVGRAARGDLVGPLRPRGQRVGRRLRLPRPAGPCGLHRAHRRPRLR